jgi:hypothetical protein
MPPPLAHRILLESTIPPSARVLDDRCGLLSLPFHEVVWFDVTKTPELTAAELEGRLLVPGAAALMTLPARFVWIEELSTDYGRAAFLLTRMLGEQSDGAEIEIAVNIVTARPFRARAAFFIQLHSARAARRCLEKQGLPDETAKLLGGHLATINSPDIARTAHRPPRDLQRRLARAHGVPDPYPLRCWFEMGHP